MHFSEFRLAPNRTNQRFFFKSNFRTFWLPGAYLVFRSNTRQCGLTDCWLMALAMQNCQSTIQPSDCVHRATALQFSVVASIVCCLHANVSFDTFFSSFFLIIFVWLTQNSMWSPDICKRRFGIALYCLVLYESLRRFSLDVYFFRWKFIFLRIHWIHCIFKIP